MKALIMEGPGDAGLREVDDPVPGDYEALVEMLVCGICNSTDRMLREGTFAGGVSYPSVLGHESVGRVVALGRHVRHLKPGQLVTRCSAYSWEGPPVRMYWGGFAERGVVLDGVAWREDHPGEEGGQRFPHVVFEADSQARDLALGISLSETWSVAAEAGGLVDRVVGVSGTGVAGLSFVVYSRLLGAARVICVGRREERARLAVSLGATDAVAGAHEAKEVFDRLGGADVVFEASGDPGAVNTAYGWVKPGGRLIIYSAPEAPSPLEVMRAPRNASLTVARPREGAVLREVVGMISTGLLPREKFVSHTYEFAQIEEAFAAVRDGGVVKALVRIQD